MDRFHDCGGLIHGEAPDVVKVHSSFKIGRLATRMLGSG